MELQASLRNRVVSLLRNEAFELPRLPEAVRKAMELARDPEASLRELAALARSDPQLAGKLVSVANAPYYRPMQAVVSVEQAVIQLGLRAVRNILVTVASQTSLFHLAQHRAMGQALFRHALATARAAETLGHALGMDLEWAYLAGLLHDCGMAVALQAGLEAAGRSEGSGDVMSVVRAAAEVHSEASALVIVAWKLPDVIQTAVRCHEFPHLARERAAAAALIYAADRICQHAGYAGPGEERPADLVSDPVFKSLAVGPREIALAERAATWG